MNCAQPLSDHNQGRNSLLHERSLPGAAAERYGMLLKKREEVGKKQSESALKAVTSVQTSEDDNKTQAKPQTGQDKPPALSTTGKPPEKTEQAEKDKAGQDVEGLKNWIAKHRAAADKFREEMRKKVDAGIEKYQQGSGQKNGGTPPANSGKPSDTAAVGKPGQEETSGANSGEKAGAEKKPE